MINNKFKINFYLLLLLSSYFIYIVSIENEKEG